MPAPAVRRPTSTIRDSDPAAVDLTATATGDGITLSGPTADTLAVGTILGKYQLTERLGSGTSSVVYRARHLRLNIPVAVKVMRLSEFENPEPVLRQLESEAVLLARLNHPNIVRLWDFEDAGGLPYLVTEYVEGRSFADLIAAQKRVPQDFALDVCRQVVEGLAEAHRVGVVHRDVKPANVLMAKDGSVKIADLGLATVTGERCQQLGLKNPTTTNGLAGTAAYLAPEAAQGGGDHRADVYSLGCTLYHAIAGTIPFPGKSTMQVILKHLTEAPVPLAERVPGVEAKASALVGRMMAKKPADRFAGYDELKAAFDAVLD